MKNVFWDFDGVILDSMEIRDWGFREIFKNFDKKEVEELIKYHTLNGGLSRYVKIRHFFNKILFQKISDEKVQCYANLFSSLMKQKLLNKDNLIPETIRFIKSNYKAFDFHVVSGSDEKELRYLCKELGIQKYFITINGSPTPKSKIVSRLIDDYKLDKKETCLIGDSINDYEAAISNKIIFFGFNNISLAAMNVNYIHSFKDFHFR